TGRGRYVTTREVSNLFGRTSTHNRHKPRTKPRNLCCKQQVSARLWCGTVPHRAWAGTLAAPAPSAACRARIRRALFAGWEWRTPIAQRIRAACSRRWTCCEVARSDARAVLARPATRERGIAPCCAAAESRRLACGARGPCASDLRRKAGDTHRAAPV